MRRISHVDAQLKGLNRFYTGKTCKHGHVAERYINNGACVTCCAICCEIYKKNNKEHVAEYQRNYYEANK